MRIRYVVTSSILAVLLTMFATPSIAVGITVETPAPSYDRTMDKLAPINSIMGEIYSRRGPSYPDLPQLGPPLLFAPTECFDFDDNPIFNAGFYSIPPDPHVSVGPIHEVNIVNRMVEWREKSNPDPTPLIRMSLKDFFFAGGSGIPGPTPLTPTTSLGTGGFDPKTIYDQHLGRFIVIALERWDVGSGDASDESRILVAVSKTSDPTLGWWFQAIDAKSFIGTGFTWADYPGIAVDATAIYLTMNMFPFSTSTGSFGAHLFIMDKAWYAGPNQTAGVTHVDPYAATSGSGSIATTTQPAHIFGPPPALPALMGTYLVSYSGLTAAPTEFLQIIQISDPLATGGGPFYTHQFLAVGDIDLNLAALPDAPQSGGLGTIEVNDRRALNAVWRENCLYLCATLEPNAPSPDAGQTTAHWWALSTAAGAPGISLLDQGDVGAEDLGPGTYTFFPSVMIDCAKNMAIGFSASNESIFCGAYYASRYAIDPPGFIGATCALQIGLDYYVRTFGGTRNRWGDYSGLALCPVDDATFWVYNEYAMLRGTAFGGEDGRWGTKLGSFVLKAVVPVAISRFSAVADGKGSVHLSARLAWTDGIDGISIYRSVDEGATKLLHAITSDFREDFSFIDADVLPGRTYHYQLSARDGEGEVRSQRVSVRLTDVAFTLSQNAPNPFNPTTSISFALTSKEFVTLRVYNAAGKLVSTLVDEIRGQGNHNVQWNGTDTYGRTVSSGVYYYRLWAGKTTESKRMVLLK